MKRREFIMLLGGAAAAWPVAAGAQPAGRRPDIGFLGTATASAWSNWVAAFVTRLHELGWIEGRTVAIEYRWADGRSERFSEIAAEFVRLKVDVIVTSGVAVLPAKQATSVIPIVFAVASDPIGPGMVTNLARPGHNVTGLSLQAPDLAGKRVGLLLEVVPGLRRLAVLANIKNPAAELEMREVEAMSSGLDFAFIGLEIRRVEDIAAAFEALNERADALYVCGTDPLINANRIRINTLALGARLPTMHSQKEYVEAGGLMSYGPNIADLFRRAAEYVDKILHGANPGDIPVEQPTRFDFIINLTTAKALALSVSPSLLARADEVIE
jgi:putative tryptophan/tyrosine transport system substrate-binding protein